MCGKYFPASSTLASPKFSPGTTASVIIPLSYGHGPRSLILTLYLQRHVSRGLTHL
jgi:hypothetical protein